MRRLIIAILAITAVAVALLVGATRAQAERPHLPTCSDRQQGTDSRPEQPQPARR
jgi:Ni/Co efflux regulator RcnB